MNNRITELFGIQYPVIAGGMVTEPDDVKQALVAGAIGVSTSARNLWALWTIDA